MRDLFRELVVASRQLREARGAVAGLTVAIALSVGANLAVFSQLWNVIAPSSPFADDTRLVVVENTGGYSTEDMDAALPYGRRLSAPDFRDVEDRQRSFIGLGTATSAFTAVLSGADRPRAVCRMFVSPRMLDVLGVTPVLGHTFGRADSESTKTGAVLLTEGVWRRYFAGDPSVVGRSVQLDEQPFSVIGVLPRNTADMLIARTELFPSPGTDLCVITPLERGSAGEAEGVLEYLRSERGRNAPSLLAVGRLRPESSLAQANVELAVIAAHLRDRNPQRPRNFGLRAVPLRTWQTRAVRGVLMMLAGAAALTLLVACANTGGLLMAECVKRAPEFATRIALGATRGHLLRVMLARSTLWSLPGGLVGLLLASAAVGVGRWGNAGDPAPIESLHLHAWLVAISVALTLVVALVSAAATAWGLRTGSMVQLLRGGASSGRRPRRPTAMILLTVQMSAAVALTFGAALLLRSMWILSSGDYGFDLQNGFVVEVRLPRSRYQASSDQIRFYDRALSRIRALPGVVAAGFSSSPPLTDSVSTLSGDLMLTTSTETRKIERLNAQFVTSGYIEALGKRVQRGRSFSQDDDRGAGTNIIVDEAFCRRFIRGADALGATLWFGRDPLSVIGIVTGTRQSAGAIGPPSAQEEGGTVYLLPAKWSRPTTWRFLAVRTIPDRPEVASVVVSQLRGVEAVAVVGDPNTFTGLLATKTAGHLRLSVLITVMGCIVILLATASLTAALSQLVTLRSREIAIRCALGAPPAQIVALAMQYVGATLASGLVLGVGAGVLFGRALASQLYGVHSTDPWTFSVVFVVLLVVCVVAGIGPMRRACRIDLPSVLRQ